MSTNPAPRTTFLALSLKRQSDLADFILVAKWLIMPARANGSGPNLVGCWRRIWRCLILAGHTPNLDICKPPLYRLIVEVGNYQLRRPVYEIRVTMPCTKGILFSFFITVQFLRSKVPTNGRPILFLVEVPGFLVPQEARGFCCEYHYS